MAIEITERAAGEFQRILSEQGLPKDTCLRASIKGGGCSGFIYTLDLARQPDEFDEVFESNGVRIVCDPKSYLYLNGTTIDFRDELMGRGFVFNNPNAKQTCGCGASFAV